jgi:hypothetical protein
MKLTILLIYGVLFSLSFLFFAVLWHLQMPDVYFVCRDKGFVTDFLPPFVTEGASGEFFIKPPHVIYVIWGVYIGLAVVIPAICSWLLVRIYDHALRKSWS